LKGGEFICRRDQYGSLVLIQLRLTLFLLSISMLSHLIG
jgi:hypothetical protein